MIENKEEFPLITVITPSYNNGPYLIDAIKSVLMQTYPTIEYIIAGDSPTYFPWRGILAAQYITRLKLLFYWRSSSRYILLLLFVTLPTVCLPHIHDITYGKRPMI